MIPVQLFPLEVYLHFKSSVFPLEILKVQLFPLEKLEVIKIPDISPRSFSNILCYFYGGTVILDEEDGVEVLNLYMASNELELHKLKDHVGNFLKKHQRYFFQKHPIDMIDIIFTHDIFADLREFCLKTLCAEPHILLDLIPKEIKQEALRAHMLPGTRSSMASVPNLTAQVNGPIRRATLPKIDSKIITTQHVLSFSSWIDGFEYKNAKIIPYDFNLLLRGSRDGMDPQTFHRLCDNKGPTLIVIKIRNSKRIVGGYNPLDWDSNGRSKTSPDGFIFSFDELETPNIGRVKPNECSVRCYKEWGASFGNYEGGNDLAMKNKAEWKSKPVSYPDIKIPKKFICSEYEVFQIKKKRNF
ncbi:unnamed protein product [Rhizophagus irregularis]|nr:unnamed protein product [Rhizophagus irregularis]